MRPVRRWIAAAALAAASLTIHAEGTHPDQGPHPGQREHHLVLGGGPRRHGHCAALSRWGRRLREGGRRSGTGNNFLVRSAQYFLDQGFNVAIFGRPDDTTELDYADRIADKHLADVRKVLDFVKTRSATPVWLIGTSRGTVSATAAAIALQGDVEGLVLTSSVVNYRKPGAEPKQNLAAIKVPVLVLHHGRDACAQCQPHEVPGILSGFKNAPVKKQIIVDGGADPTGDECAALHWHGARGRGHHLGMDQATCPVTKSEKPAPSSRPFANADC